MNCELLRPMRADLGIDALIRKPQAFDRAAVDQVLLDNLRGVFGLHVAVPDCFGVDDNCRTVFALVETAGLVDANRVAQTRGFGKLLQLGVQLALAIRGA